ncbi:carbohydrate ABC transporter permease [Stackebrandtia nassauensis]|uniref:Binding-protein-dependent transport systems inner membrane component n=1 Tax=Stackebrandtia nassauensis (strain DSM 44728 / CIP 108903 / NRRL B-16338 / NBRC 102104 / LLR-40K-21) TaxID=446470 RepID=D3Q415_STANL|nr:carbohydrate ABC transporter permease [Stackebrandtia nassauensis]ADD45900.1 binding-protein-dependent transport systems inner membrane component [Stackebrandtia nassauensis DSM 44728]
MKQPKRLRKPWDATVLTRATLILAVLLSIWPLYWMIVIASRDISAATRIPPPLLPGGNLGDNIVRALSDESSHLMAGLVNSLIVSATVTVSVVFISTLAGFAFAKLRFRGSTVLLVTVLLTMMVPLQQIGVVPLYIMMVELGWVNTLQAVILPFLVNGFGIFLMRQYTIQAVPSELVESARMDGASTFRIYWNIVLPAVRPGIAVLALLTFMQNWNEFLWPLIVLQPDNPTVQLAIRGLSETNYGQDYSMIFTGTLLSIVPLVLVFIAFGRQIVGGLMEGAVKE